MNDKSDNNEDIANIDGQSTTGQVRPHDNADISSHSTNTKNPEFKKCSGDNSCGKTKCLSRFYIKSKKTNSTNVRHDNLCIECRLARPSKPNDTEGSDSVEELLTKGLARINILTNAGVKDDKIFLTATEACCYLGKTRRALENMVYTGKLKRNKLGNSNRYMLSAINNLIT